MGSPVTKAMLVRREEEEGAIDIESTKTLIINIIERAASTLGQIRGEHLLKKYCVVDMIINSPFK